MGFEWVMGIFALLGNIVSNMFTKENNEHAAQLNYKYGELSAENAQKRQIETYQKLYSLPAQMDQIEQAGLSPGLIYSGTGGASGSTPAAPQGAGAGAQQGKMFDIMANMDIARMQSEIDVNNANARDKNADAEIKENHGGELAEAQIANLYADTGLKNAQEAGQKVQTQILELESYVKDMTVETQIETAWEKLDNIRKENRKIAAEANIAETQDKLNKENYANLVEEQRLKVANLAQDILNKKFEIHIETEKLQAFYEQLDIMAEQNEIYRFSAEAQKEWYQDQVIQMQNELGLETEKFDFSKKYGPARDALQTITACGMAAGALVFKGAGAMMAAGRTVTNVRGFAGGFGKQ